MNLPDDLQSFVPDLRRREKEARAANDTRQREVKQPDEPPRARGPTLHEQLRELAAKRRRWLERDPPGFLRHFGVPSMLADEITDLRPDVAATAAEAAAHRQGVYWWGSSCGNGKSLAMAKAAYHLIAKATENGEAAGLGFWDRFRWASWERVLGQVRDTYGRDGASELDVIERYINCGVLFLDDIGVRVTPHEANTLYLLFGARFDAGRKLTFVTGNWSPDEVADCLGPRVHSRLFGLCDPVEVEGDDYRVRRLHAVTA